MTRRCRQARAQRVELVVQTLLGDLAISDQAPTMTHRGAERIHRRLLGVSPACTLPGEVGQRGAITVVGLEPTRAQLHTCCLRLRRSEQPHRPRMRPLEFGRPRPVQASGGFDRDHGPGRRVSREHPLQLADPLTRHGQRDRIFERSRPRC